MVPRRLEEQTQKEIAELENNKQAIEEALKGYENAYIIRSTGFKYRLSIFVPGAENEPHRCQNTCGDVFIITGISDLNIRESKQKTRSDKTRDYIYQSASFQIKAKTD